MKKILLFMLTAALAVSVFGGCSERDPAQSENTFDETVVDNETEDEEEPSVAVEKTYTEAETLTLDLFGDIAAQLSANPEIKCVVIKEGATNIPANAFANNENIEKVVLPAGVVSIEACAFMGCSALESVIIPDGLTSVGANAFYGCPLKKLELPASVSKIDSFAFRSCGELKEFYIPDSLNFFDFTAFFSCYSIERFLVSENNAKFSVDEHGVLFNKDKTVLIKCPIAVAVTEYTIPDSVTEIGANAFYDCSRLENVIIPDSVATIGMSAFRGCSMIKQLEWKGSLRTIDILGNLT